MYFVLFRGRTRAHGAQGPRSVCPSPADGRRGCAHLRAAVDGAAVNRRARGFV